jgi:hypothetical protein
MCPKRRERGNVTLPKSTIGDDRRGGEINQKQTRQTNRLGKPIS